MKILHFADLHLGIESYGVVDPETGLSSRLADVLKVLDELVDYALNENVDLVLFCGDAYKTRDPSQTQQRELAKRVKRLSDARIPLFMLVGNHDLPNAPGRANALEIFQTLSVSNVYVAARPTVQTIATVSGRVQVAALPWLRRAGLLSKDENRSLTLEQVTARMQDTLTTTVDRLARSLDQSIPAVLAAHVAVSSAKLGSERSMMLGKEPVILVSNLALPQFDYVALGHVHRAQTLSSNPPTAYSGSLERVDFGEEEDEKGFYVVELDPGASAGARCLSARFHAVSARKFLTIRASVDALAPNPAAAVMAAMAEHAADLKGAIVRVEVDCPEGCETQLNDAEIRRALGDTQTVTITRSVEKETRTRLGDHYAEELAPRRILELYLDSLDQGKLSPERRKKLLDYGERLIWEREAGL